jgi:hypothetical protein
VEAGNLIVKDSRIASSSGNGITMINGTLEATNSKIEHNIGARTCAIVTFDNSPPICADDKSGLWKIVEHPPVLTVTAEN